MKKIGIIFIVILLLSVLVFTFIKYFTQISLTLQNPKQLQSETTEFENAVITGTPTTCIFSKKDAVVEYSISGEKTYTKTMTFGKSSYFLNDGEYVYMWSDGQNSGSKVSLESVQQNENTTLDSITIKNNYKSLISNGYKIICDKLNEINKIFVPPTDINFTKVN